MCWRENLRGVIGHSSIVLNANFPTLKKSHWILENLLPIYLRKLNNTFPAVLTGLCSEHALEGNAGT